MYYHDNYSYWHPRPTERDFELEVVSKHPDFSGRALKKYALDGINSVGVWGDEPFEVHFHNKSAEDVQVRVSLDGTDILTGKPASLEVNHEMWVVRAHRTLHLRAWAENSNGGARFVFTSGDKSVALHAHGDISHKGIISAAVFTERDRPQRIMRARVAGLEAFGGGSDRRTLGGGSVGSVYSSNAVPAAAPLTSGTKNMSAGVSKSASMDFMDLDRERSDNSLESFKKEASVGAGEYTEQKTRTVKGLDNPILNSIVRVRYMWWDDLQAKLHGVRFEDPHPTGFPAEKIRTFADLSGVPRVNSVATTRTVETVRAPVRTTTPSAPVSYDRVL